MRGANACFCRFCDFVGDVFELFAKFENKSLSDAIQLLKLEGAVDWTDLEVSQYLGRRAENRRLIDAWEAGRRRLAAGTSVVNEILQHCGVHFSGPFGKTLAKHHAAVRAEDFDSCLLSKARERDLKSLRLFTGMAIACWNGSLLVGMWVFSRVYDEYYRYIQLAEIGSEAIGYGHAIGMGTDLCFVVNDPRIAFRMMARQAPDELMNPVPFVCPAPHTSTDSTYALGCPKVIYLPFESMGPLSCRWYGRACRYGDAQTVPAFRLPFAPLTQWPPARSSTRGIVNYYRDLAVPAHQALGAYLLTRPPAEAAKLASDLELTTPAQHQVMAYFSELDVAFLLRAFDTDKRTLSIEIDGERIQERREGWFCGDVLVSEAIIRIDLVQIDAATHKSLVTGTISFLEPGTNSPKVIPFREDLDVISNGTAKWLRKHCLGKADGWVEVNSRWSNKLIRIAKMFGGNSHKVQRSEHSYGWDRDNRILRLPRFTVDDAGVHRTTNRVDGPDITYPGPLTASEWEAFKQSEFCLVALAMLGNLDRTARGLAGYSLAVQSAPHIVERIADSFGMKTERNPSLGLVERYARSPLPMFTSWSDDNLRGLVELPHRHVMLSLDQWSFRMLAYDRTWLRLPVENFTGYESLRWIFHAIPFLLSDKSPVNDDGGAYFDHLAKRISRAVAPHCGQHKLLSTAKELDHHWFASQHSEATMLVRLLHWLASSGKLAVKEVNDGVEIKIADAVVACASPVLPPLNAKKLTAALVSGKMLVNPKDISTKWVIGGASWSLIGAFDRAFPEQ